MQQNHHRIIIKTAHINQFYHLHHIKIKKLKKLGNIKLKKQRRFQIYSSLLRARGAVQRREHSPLWQSCHGVKPWNSDQCRILSKLNFFFYSPQTKPEKYREIFFLREKEKKNRDKMTVNVLTTIPIIFEVIKLLLEP